MHYHKSKFLRFANAAFEFLLLILTFIFAGWLRSYTPMGSQFFMWDIWTFLPISALYALVIVGCNAVLGSYRTLHLRNSIKQLFLIALTSLMGLALMATAFYVFRVSQLSRLLLVYYYLLSVIMIYLKRLVFDRLADAYVRKHDIVPRAWRSTPCCRCACWKNIPLPPSQAGRCSSAAGSWPTASSAM